MCWEPVPMIFVVFVPDVLVELLVQDLRTSLGIHSIIVPCGGWPCWTLIKSKTCIHYWEFKVPLLLVVMFVHWTLIKSCTENELQKFCRLDLFLNCFSSVALSLFSKPNTPNNKKHHNTFIMTKMTSSATTSHATPVKAKTGKSVVKNKILHIEEEPPVTALKQLSPASVSTATTASSFSSNQESSPASISTASTATTASSISLSQSTMTTSSKQSNLSNLARALDFGNL
jgi:hypothetical protein